ncbi:uncharacterized protein LOC130999946 [Salvia miltiorrhiza]|uniref:uncharacterized protein LOC130999946 n=1 Tax=Salvia miltiorrhiza TaxID=226208 RepID=UPI0025ABBBD1|nr:uncharacterized protein LOC130999946 [Salvia miltiorrhiza]
MHKSSSTQSSQTMASSPFLMLPLLDQTTQEIHHLSLYNLKDKKPHNLKFLETLKNLKNPQCIGSSHGFLAFLDETKANPFLLNPFTNAQIHLPPKETKISKLILSQSPTSHPTTFAAVAMHAAGFGLTANLSLCRGGDAAWRRLPGQGETYYDVVCCSVTNTLLALAPGPTVESWDLNEEASPEKTVVIQESCPRSLQLARKTFPADLYTSQWYLALSPAGEIFMAVRYIGEFVSNDGEVVYEGDTLTDDSPAPVICPYRTMGFRVFRVDAGRSEWVDVESLDDSALFLGGNESVMVSAAAAGAKRNAIYFTDDYWERIDEDYSYGGHDLGVFCMEDGSIETVFDFEEDKIEPPPFWITLH